MAQNRPAWLSRTQYKHRTGGSATARLFLQCVSYFAQLPLDNSNVMRYYWGVIRSFRDKQTERIFSRQFSRRLPSDLHRVAWRKLAMLDAAEHLEDLRIPPGNHLERLSGNREGQHSIRINDQWRICFQWSEGDAYEVEIVDYH